VRIHDVKCREAHCDGLKSAECLKSKSLLFSRFSYVLVHLGL
jgi:hypothetical protein